LENSVKQDDISRYEDWFTASEDATTDARAEGERARDYVDGKQLTDAEIATLQKRGQPPVVINRIRRKIEWLLGLEIKQRTDPKAFPRTEQHQQGAEAITDALRFVADNEDFDQTRSLVYDNMLVEGFGGAEVVHEMDAKGQVQVRINHYPWDRLFYDPHSRRHDFSDARYKGAVVWVDADDFKANYKVEAPKVDLSKHVDQMMTESSSNDTYDDRPSDIWFDAKRKRIRTLLMWYKEGEDWHYCQFIKGQKLDGGKSPYVDEDGQSVCPLILQSLYVGRENQRYGVIRDMFDPQDEINKRRSKALHSVNSRQVRMSKDIGDPNAIRRELARPDGLIQTEDGPDTVFEILPTGDLASGQFNLLQEAKNEIDLLGANSALSGESGEQQSGRAVLARQQGGMIEIASPTDKLHHFTREVYRHAWMRIRQFWTEERWVRVTDDETNARFVQLNKQVTLGEKIGQLPPEQQMQAIQELQLVPNDPRLNQIIDVENDVEKIDLDVTIEEVPDTVTQQGETFEALMKYGQVLPPEVLIEADPSMPSKKKEKLLKLLEQSKAAPNPQQELEMMGMQADVQKTQAETQKIATETALPLAL